MTDEQIIKALECCIGNIQCGKCSIFGTINCMNNLMQDALDLINRQKAEIERLLQKLQQAKSEAIKEFAERLKDDMRLDEECKYNCISCCYECKEFVPQIDNLVKEMTGEEKMNKQHVEDDIA